MTTTRRSCAKTNIPISHLKAGMQTEGYTASPSNLFVLGVGVFFIWFRGFFVCFVFAGLFCFFTARDFIFCEN